MASSWLRIQRLLEAPTTLATQTTGPAAPTATSAAATAAPIVQLNPGDRVFKKGDKAKKAYKVVKAPEKNNYGISVVEVEDDGKQPSWIPPDQLQKEGKSIDEMGCGAAMAGPGPQMPGGIKKRKKKVAEMLQQNPDITVREAVAYFSSLDEGMGEVIGHRLDAGSFELVGEAIREHLIREVVSAKVKEVVRKKKNGDGFVLYKPNAGKKGPPKAVAPFPTKLAAKRAELAKFPPKEPAKRARLRKEIEKLAASKGNKGKGKESGTPEEFAARREREKAKKEEFLRPIIAALVMESLIKESPEDWIQFLNKVPRAAMAKDKKFAGLQKKIDKTAEKTLDLAFKSVARAVGKNAKLRSHGVRRDEANRPFISFTAEINGVQIDPLYIRIGDNGIPSLDIPQKAKGDMAKADPNSVKLFRAELITAQEQVLDDMNGAQTEIGKRDAYLEKSQAGIDDYVAGLSPLGLSLLKQLLVQKYRKLR